MQMQKGTDMKNKKKQHIGKTIFMCLPMLVLLACGATGQRESLSELMQQADSAEADFADLQAGKSADDVLTVAADSGRETDASAQQTAFVHICGEVVSPGVYEVAADARVCDVLLLAGGFTKEAATDAVNMAEKVCDGMQVVIPGVTEAQVAAELASQAEDGRVNLNTASMAQLCTLPGIGESRAAAIIAYREEHGGFEDAEEIMKVSGIKEGMFEKLKEYVYVK